MQRKANEEHTAIKNTKEKIQRQKMQRQKMQGRKMQGRPLTQANINTGKRFKRKACKHVKLSLKN